MIFIRGSDHSLYVVKLHIEFLAVLGEPFHNLDRLYFVILITVRT